MAGSSVLRAQKFCRKDSFVKMFSSDQDHPPLGSEVQAHSNSRSSGAAGVECAL